MMNSIEYQYLLSIKAVKERAAHMLQLALEDKTHFWVRINRLNHLAEFTMSITRNNYPRGNIPLHSRWRHFVINGFDRAQFLQTLPPLECAKAQFDLAVIAVLLDAGAGSEWVYRDSTGQEFKRSEGLAIASLELFAAGLFSAEKRLPWRVDAEALQRLSLEKLAASMQVSSANPLLGLAGRLQLLHNLGWLLSSNTAIFSSGRPSDLYDYLRSTFGNKITASDLVSVLLLQLNSIWPERVIDGYPLGDIWQHAALKWAPFHKLTLWLALSLVEPLQTAELQVIELEQMPGLAEYRNGGLFIDGGVLEVKDRALLLREHQPSDALIVEWRGLTIALLEKLALLIRNKMGVDAQTLPLVNILQGGSWQAGRQLAFQRSPLGISPLRYCSTGTVF